MMAPLLTTPSLFPNVLFSRPKRCGVWEIRVIARLAGPRRVQTTGPRHQAVKNMHRVYERDGGVHSLNTTILIYGKWHFRCNGQ